MKEGFATQEMKRVCFLRTWLSLISHSHFLILSMPIWFLCKIRYQQEAENGKLNTINEQYLLDAVSFTDAEARLHQQIGSVIKEFSISSVSRMRLTDILHFDDSPTWYRGKANLLMTDEKTGKEKKIANVILVSAPSVKAACERLEENLSSLMDPFEITDVGLTKILEVFPYFEDDEAGVLPENSREALATEPIGEENL